LKAVKVQRGLLDIRFYQNFTYMGVKGDFHFKFYFSLQSQPNSEFKMAMRYATFTVKIKNNASGEVLEL
jgi:hypothetical protein